MRFEIDLIKSLLNNDYSLLETREFRRLNFKRFLKICSVNRLLYIVSLSLSKSGLACLSKDKLSYVREIVQQGNLKVQAYKEALSKLKEIFEKHSIEWLLIKTDKGAPYVVNDVDILVKGGDFEQAKNLIQGNIFSQKSNQAHIAMKNSSKIDLHRSFYQLGTLYLDTQSLWKGALEREFHGISYKTPSLTNDAAMIILNSLYGCFYIPLLDCFYFKDNISLIDFREIHSQAEEYGWNKGLGVYLSALCSIFNVLFKNSGYSKIIMDKILISSERISARLRLPYLFGYPQIYRIFKERGNRIRGQDLFMLTYYVFANLRYKLTTGRRVPIHSHWFEFK